MPHDCNGRILSVGDQVQLKGTVTSILNTEDYCNVSVELNIRMKPSNDVTEISNINASQVEKNGN